MNRKPAKPKSPAATAIGDALADRQPEKAWGAGVLRRLEADLKNELPGERNETTTICLADLVGLIAGQQSI
jgi:hypothetical protein